MRSWKISVSFLEKILINILVLNTFDTFKREFNGSYTESKETSILALAKMSPILLYSTRMRSAKSIEPAKRKKPPKRDQIDTKKLSPSVRAPVLDHDRVSHGPRGDPRRRTPARPPARPPGDCVTRAIARAGHGAPRLTRACGRVLSGCVALSTRGRPAVVW